MSLVGGTDDVDYMYAQSEAIEPSQSGTPEDVSMTFYRMMGQMQIGVYEDIPGYHVQMQPVSISSTVGGKTIAGIAAIPVIYNESSSPKFSRSEYIVGGIPAVDFTKTKNLTSYASESEVKSNQAGCFSSVGMSPLTSDKYIVDRTDISEVTANTVTMSPDIYRVIPQQACGFQVVMNFDLIADDTKEVIEVRNARVYIEPTYTNWEENTVYTYIFKITKNTSGTTNPPDDPTPDDPQDLDPDKPALYPIVFDNLTIADMTTSEVTTVWAVNPGKDESNPLDKKNY